MTFNLKYILSILGFICCICLQLTAALPFPQQPESAPKRHFKITVQNSGKQPQKGMILRIWGEQDEFTSNEQGVFDFEAECPEESSRSASLYFPENPSRSAYTFQLQTITSDTILVVDGEQDILSFRQSNTLFPIQGIVKDQSGNPWPRHKSAYKVPDAGPRPTLPEISPSRPITTIPLLFVPTE